MDPCQKKRQITLLKFQRPLFSLTEEELQQLEHARSSARSTGDRDGIAAFFFLYYI